MSHGFASLHVISPNFTVSCPHSYVQLNFIYYIISLRLLSDKTLQKYFRWCSNVSPKGPIEVKGQYLVEIMDATYTGKVAKPSNFSTFLLLSLYLSYSNFSTVL